VAEIEIPATLTSIGDGAFAGCTSLSEFTVASANPYYIHSDDKKMLLSKDGKTLIAYALGTRPETMDDATITTIAGGALYGCTSLTTVNLPAAEAIGEQAFYGCTGLTTVNLPAAAEAIDYQAFAYCTSLVTVDLPAAEAIGEQAFAYCTSLVTVDLPAAEAIGEQAFVDCTSLTTVNLPKATAIGVEAFTYTGDQSITITLGATVPRLEREIFREVNVDKTVTIQVPSSVKAQYNTAWQTAFKGGNAHITLKIETYP
jgi:hypothetical protein